MGDGEMIVRGIMWVGKGGIGRSVMVMQNHS